MIAEPVLIDEHDRDDEPPAAYDSSCSPVMRHGVFPRRSAARGPAARLRWLLRRFGPLLHANAHASSTLNSARTGESPAVVLACAIGFDRCGEPDHALRLDDLLPTSARRHSLALAGARAPSAEVRRSASAQTCRAVVR